MAWRKEYLDIVLVPSGLLIMCSYHLYLLYRCQKFPETTSIGCENHYRKAWVERVLQVEGKDRSMYLTVITSTITASTFLASTSLGLSSLIGAWVGRTSHNIFINSVIYGDTSSSVISIKYISLLTCFLVAFASFLQCVRSLVHANFLISMPNSDIPVSYVQKAVVRGSAFWTIGLRAIYFATNLLLWIFGPIPMFVASLVMVVILNILDTNSTPLQVRHQKIIHKHAKERASVDATVETQSRKQRKLKMSTFIINLVGFPVKTAVSNGATIFLFNFLHGLYVLLNWISSISYS